MAEIKTQEDNKRQLIYAGERLKELALEIAAVVDERKIYEGTTSVEEEEKRRRIYLAERLVRLQGEREELLAKREALMDSI